MGFLDKIKGLANGGEEAFPEPDKGILLAPATGKVTPMGDVPDEVFASGVLGAGCAVWPEEGVVRAPASGTVTVAMPHAVGITAPDGSEILVHIGIDTVEMAGVGFELLVAKGDKVSAGQTVVKFNRDKVAAAGHPDCVVLAVSNPEQHGDASLLVEPGFKVHAGDELLRVS